MGNITASLSDRCGNYYINISYYDENDNRRKKGIKTEIPFVKGNKKRAEKARLEAISEFEKQINSPELIKQESKREDGVNLVEYINTWYMSIKPFIDINTWESYGSYIIAIRRYFEKDDPYIQDITKSDIENFVSYQLQYGLKDSRSERNRKRIAEQKKEIQYNETKEGYSIRTVRSQKILLFTVFDKAVDDDIISKNPVSRVEVSRRNNSQLQKEHDFFDYEEAMIFLRFVYDSNDVLKDLFYFAVIYGMRRSELLGLKWDMIDFEHQIIKIRRTVVQSREIHEKDTTKTYSSKRNYPISKSILEKLNRIKAEKEENKKFYEGSYHDSDYVFTWENGTLFRPDFVYKHSKAIFTQLGRPNFTFHNLRSTCVSILQEKDWTVKDCQEWLGHNDFQTTMNIYTHIAKRSQKEKAEKLDELFNL